MMTSRHRATVLSVLGVVLLLSACSKADEAPPPTVAASANILPPSDGQPGPLEGSWTVTALNDQPLPDGITVTMDFTGDQVAGNGGCNSYGAEVTADVNGHMTFGPVRSTMMACQGDAAEVEATFFKALEKVDGYQGGDTQTDLALVDDGGAQLIAITKGTAAA